MVVQDCDCVQTLSLRLMLVVDFGKVSVLTNFC